MTKFQTTTLKAFADDKVNVTQLFQYVFDRVENFVGKGENAGYQHFLVFNDFLARVVKTRDCLVNKLTNYKNSCLLSLKAFASLKKYLWLKK